MLTPNELAEQFSQIATEYEERARRENDKAQKSVLRELAAHYLQLDLQLAEQARRGPYNCNGRQQCDHVTIEGAEAAMDRALKPRPRAVGIALITSRSGSTTAVSSSSAIPP